MRKHESVLTAWQEGSSHTRSRRVSARLGGAPSRTRPRTAMSFVEGIKAIPADIAAVPTREGKLRRAAEIGKILVDEVTGVLKAIPYGIRALRQHKKLPDALARSDDGAHVREVSIARNVRYADSPRAVMDVYLPRGVSLADEFALDADGRVVDAVATEASVETSGFPEKRNKSVKNDSDDGLERASVSSLATKPDHPVALFIHGGVWAVGEKWQFAPMAHRLAEEGVVTCVATYSLFPQATAPRMWEEVSDALTFTMDNAARLFPGASAERVVLMGHSAGAHLCAMALMHRRGALATNEPTGAAVGGSAETSSPAGDDETPPTFRRRVDDRQPRAFVGLCGVYDIDTHYKYEDSRGVALVSTMARAMGGRQGFDRASPLRLVRADPEAVAYDQTARRRAEPSEERFLSFDKSNDATRADDVNGVVTDVAFETGLNPKNDFMRRTDWAPMGIMDTDENISVGEIVARARSALAPASEKENDLFAGETGHAETERLAARATRRRVPPPGPPAGAFAGDEAARQAGYVQPHENENENVFENEPRENAARNPAARPIAPGCFPPAYLLAGCADVTVPWFESAEFHLALADAGARSRMLLYLTEPHGSFVLKWRPRGARRRSPAASAARGDADGAGDGFAWNDGLGDGDGLTPYCRDIVRVIKRA